MKAQVSIIMGSDSDWPIMQAAATALKDLKIPFETQVISAHRTPAEMLDYGKKASGRGIKIILAGAGGAAHLPGMVASVTELPVIGVPINITSLNGLDSLLSIVQMPGGVPVATMAIDGAKNAALFAARTLALNDNLLKARLLSFQKKQIAKVKTANKRINSKKLK